MMKKYNSSPAGLLILFSVALLIEALTNYNGIAGFLRALAFIAVILVILFLLQRRTYLLIDADELRYSHYLFQKTPVTISDIVEIRKGPAFGPLGVALYIFYRRNNHDEQLKIYSRNFSRRTLMLFLRDLKQINRSVRIDPYFVTG